MDQQFYYAPQIILKSNIFGKEAERSLTQTVSVYVSLTYKGTLEFTTIGGDERFFSVNALQRLCLSKGANWGRDANNYCLFGKKSLKTFGSWRLLKDMIAAILSSVE
jgi:hypothetical protein